MPNDNWETPDSLFQKYDNIYHFVLDAAANKFNHKCPEWLGPGGVYEDALTCSWLPWLKRGNIFLNPPYSRGLQRKFVEKAVAEVQRYYMQDKEWYGHAVVALLPADTSTKLFHEVIQLNGEIEFLKGRVQFVGAPGKPKFANLIAIFE